MEQMKCYKGLSSNTRYEDLPLSRRIHYWTEYLDRLVAFSLTQTELTPAQRDQLISETERVNALLRVLKTVPIPTTVPSKINPVIIISNPHADSDEHGSSKSGSFFSASTPSNKNVRTGRKRRAARRSDAKT